MSEYDNPGHLFSSLFCIICMQVPYTAEEDAKSQFLLDPKSDTSWWMIANKATPLCP